MKRMQVARHESSQPYLKSNSLVLKKFKIGTKASGSRSIKIFQKYKEPIRSDCTRLHESAIYIYFID
jgi:hypothetical protein